MEIIIILAIVLYSSWVIKRKIKAIKAGKFDCGGSCAGCSGCSGSCGVTPQKK